jgi:hypothetical protein
MKYYLHQIYSN